MLVGLVGFGEITMAMLVMLTTCLLRYALFGRLRLTKVGPGLVLVIATSFNFVHKRGRKVLINFFTNLVASVRFNAVLKFCTLLCLMVNFMGKLFRRLCFSRSVGLPLFLVSIDRFLCNVVVCLLVFVLQDSFGFLCCLGHVVIPRLVCAVIVALKLCPLVLFVGRGLRTRRGEDTDGFI